MAPIKETTLDNPKFSLTQQGPKSDLKATNCVRIMLEAFGLTGDFTLTTQFGHDQGRPEWFGIRLRHHFHSGLEMQIQPEKGTSRYYDSYLAWKNHRPDELSSVLHSKFAGQKFFRPGEWKDPAKVVSFPIEKRFIPPEVAVSTVREASTSFGGEQGAAKRELGLFIQKYAKEKDGRLLILDAVWQKYKMSSFVESDFCELIRNSCCAGVSDSSLKKLLKALIDAHFVNPNPIIIDTPTFSLSDGGFAFLNQLFYGGKLSEVEKPTARESARQEDWKVKIREISEKARKHKEACQMLVTSEDELKLKLALVSELEDQTKKTKEICFEIAQKIGNLQKIVNDEDLKAARKEFEDVTGDQSK